MHWILLGLILGSTIALTYVVWRKWIAPWGELEKLVAQIRKGEQPRTLLIAGGPQARRVGVALEELLARQRELISQIAQRESGTETILAAMEDGLLVVDAERRLVLANRSFQQILQLREISVGTSLLGIVRDTRLDRLISEALQTGDSKRREITLRDRRFEISAVPMKNGIELVTGVVVLFHDITQLKQLDEVRKDFVANVSHELRTPLSILRGYIETLRDNPKTPTSELARILGVMERHSKRLGLLVEDLLTLARLESTNPNLQLSNVRVDDLLSSVVRDWEKRFADKKLKVIVDLASDATMIRADETRLHEVLYNLLDNAVKYSSVGSEIRLRTQRLDGQVALSVSDTGIGIGEEDLPRVFERFYRVDKARSSELGGTGLGLSIVKHIAQLHGGRVEAESELGRGTTIRVLLPVGTTAVPSVAKEGGEVVPAKNTPEPEGVTET
jgi:two-component system phosphate regulon sensor histidine kinase PhoR